jgi:hypothetical protein
MKLRSIPTTAPDLAKFAVERPAFSHFEGAEHIVYLALAARVEEISSA